MEPISLLRIGALSAAAFLTMSTLAAAKNCEDDSLQEVSDSGEILMMMSGAVYQVLGGGEVDSALWLPVDDVLICSSVVVVKGQNYVMYEIINRDENGEKVDALRLR
jgi:hypothetical protein